jgi:hypothetical protein
MMVIKDFKRPSLGCFIKVGMTDKITMSSMTIRSIHSDFQANNRLLLIRRNINFDLFL